LKIGCSTRAEPSLFAMRHGPLGASRNRQENSANAGYLAAAGLAHGVRDHRALAYNLRAVADLLDLRVEPPIGSGPRAGDA
jgi:hypothetical protein